MSAITIVVMAQNPNAPRSGLTPEQQRVVDATIKAQADGQASVPTVSLGPGLTAVPDYRQFKADPPGVNLPEGFTPIFNGKDLTGWHVSKVARHGTTPDFRVVHGVIVGTQQPYGHGGLLLTDKKYRNFELTMEVKPDWGCDSGIFFRTTEAGTAYQITMDYLGNGNGGLARMIAEGGISLANPGAAPPGRGARGGAQPPSAASRAWNREEWNLVRIRVEGEAPKLTVWLNGELVNEQQDTANHAFEGMVEYPIALQVHGGTVRWTAGGFWRWRNIGIKELQ